MCCTAERTTTCPDTRLVVRVVLVLVLATFAFHFLADVAAAFSGSPTDDLTKGPARCGFHSSAPLLLAPALTALATLVFRVTAPGAVPQLWAQPALLRPPV